MATTHGKYLLTKAQIRLLGVLAEEQGSLTLHDLAERSNVPVTHIVGFVRKQSKAKKTPALCEQGLVEAAFVDVDGRDECIYAITSDGLRLTKELAKTLVVDDDEDE